MSEELFKFKQFSVSHSRSSMKVGVDGVLLGAWASSCEGNVLDVGTGCGLVSLMMAQRTKKAAITGIDIDSPSVEEANENFRKSPWNDRLVALRESFFNRILLPVEPFDLILSNPPFFKSGVKELASSRLKARHQGELSPFSLITGSTELLRGRGRLSLICPAEFKKELIDKAINNSLTPLRLTFVRHHEGAPFKRLLIEFIKINGSLNNLRDVKEKWDEKSLDTGFLTLFESSGSPTSEYLELCRDFYLNF